MGINIVTVQEANADNGLKCLVHGPAGAGKTVMCATTGEQTLILSAEAGLLSIADAPAHVHVNEIESIEDIEKAYEYLTETDHDYEWLAFDSVSEIAEKVLSFEKGQATDPRQAYGALIERMTVLLKQFRDLPHLNVIVTCKQTRQEDSDTGRTLYMPSLPGAKLANDIPYLFDEVFALRVERDEDDEEYRTLQTVRDNKYVAKDRSGKLEAFEDPDLKAIYKKIYGKKKRKSGKELRKADRIAEEKAAAAKQAKKEKKKAAKKAKKAAKKKDDESPDSSAEAEEFADKVEPVIASKNAYWLLDDGCLVEVKKGGDITELTASNAEQITKVKYTKLSKEADKKIIAEDDIPF